MQRLSHMTDTELVTLARQGDQIAFTGLVEDYQTAVYNLCYRMQGDAHDAEDAAQETFLRAYRQLHRCLLCPSQRRREGEGRLSALKICATRKSRVRHEAGAETGRVAQTRGCAHRSQAIICLKL